MSRTTRELDAAGEAPGEVRRLDGAVATSQPVAVDAALEVLRDGGNAVDAAVCAAAVLGVVEPMSTGVGGDCFALVWKPGSQAPRALNGSGPAPRAATLEALRARGLTAMPQDGILPVTVPGALSAWDVLVREEGTRSLGELLEPAARVARDGFVVTPVVARDWAVSEARLASGYGTDAWLSSGRAPRAGETFRQVDLAAALSTIASDGTGALYGGSLGQAVAETSRALDGWLALDDLAAAAECAEWVEPLEGRYRGHPIFVPPPNGQGLVTLVASGILDDFPLGDVDEVERQHLMVEAVKLAFEVGREEIGDPGRPSIDLDRVLSEEALERRRGRIGTQAAVGPSAASPTDTVHVSVVDGVGGCCSLINSVFHHFGAAVVAPETGITLQNRGALFTTEAEHASALGPGRRSYHTIVPVMVFREGHPWLVLGVVGGFQQPQGHVQLLSNLVDRAMEPQPAVDAPRFRWMGGRAVRLESGMADRVVDGLRGRGHEIVDADAHGGFGGAQLVRIDRQSGRRDGASDPRKDGRFATTSVS